MTWDVLLSGLIGAVVGALGSIVGGLWATRQNIKLQRKAELERKTEQIKLSAAILYTDIENYLKEMVHLSKVDPIINYGFGSHDSRYSDHIAVVGNKIDSSERYALHVMYGMIMKYQELTKTETFSLETLAVREMLLTKQMEYFCTVVYGSKEDFVRQTQSLSIIQFQFDIANRTMNPVYKRLFNRLNDLKEAAL
ncbi:hypothetical protein [Paenibacillus sp. P46E]|uniref:hypothetical protein n=1 Tax=Paenibacillus sp. P46E TaxID=1349436 RepID=UPI00093B0B09|nr:hypothetical protein [Paenibacillus sp. P46E]OKP95402.1 hypothetical protein A3849_26320 [Paenibacillus sp. P46E]